MFKNLLRKLIPPVILNWKHRKSLKRFEKMTVEETFSTIYQENLWGGEKGEFCSGSGSINENTRLYIEKVSDFILKNNIKTVLDVGCGDFRIMKRITEKTEVSFIGVDLVKDLIEYNNKTFGNEKIRFLQLNALNEELPAADLITIRQVLQHLSNKQVSVILKKIEKYKFALLTEHLYTGNDVLYNLDKNAGPDIRVYKKSGVFLEKPPFQLKTDTFLEYEENMESAGKNIPASMKTYLLKG